MVVSLIPDITALCYALLTLGNVIMREKLDFPI